MTQLLDFRSSQMAGQEQNSPGTPLAITPALPTYIGAIGLIVGPATQIRVNLWVTMGFNNITTQTAVVKFLIARNLEPVNQFKLSKVFYTAVQEIKADDYLMTVTLSASDFNPLPEPVPGQINYSLFVQEQTGVTVLRNGPESFSGLAVTD